MTWSRPDGFVRQRLPFDLAFLQPDEACGPSYFPPCAYCGAFSSPEVKSRPCSYFRRCAPASISAKIRGIIFLFLYITSYFSFFFRFVFLTLHEIHTEPLAASLVVLCIGSLFVSLVAPLDERGCLMNDCWYWPSPLRLQRACPSRTWTLTRHTLRP